MTKKEFKRSPAWEKLTFANNFMFCKIMESEHTHAYACDVIFLCLDDPFGKNLPVYFFENKCPDNVGGEIKLNDGAFKLFFNSSEYGRMENDEEKAFFKFLVNQNAYSDFTKSIEEKVSFANQNLKSKFACDITPDWSHAARQTDFRRAGARA